MSAPETTYIDPGKWPRLIVAGEPVTEAQADEILIRTATLYYLHSNDHDWDHIVARIVFQDERAAETDFPFQRARKRAEELRNLNLEYLDNYRISSSWIGGPRGWCDWEGRIGTANYNIGKWPSQSEVGSEWSQIAAAFPYLDLTAQLVSDGTADQVCGQWRVKDGLATEETPGALLVQPKQQQEASDAAMARFAEQIFNPASERGVSPERLQIAVDRVEGKLS